MAALTNEELQAFLASLESMLKGAGLGTSGQPPNGIAGPVAPTNNPLAGGMRGNVVSNPNRMETVQTPVGGPPGNLVAPSYAPSGVIFGGGSPYKVDDGPAILQNRLVALRDIMRSEGGQALIKKLGFTGTK